MNVFVLLNTKEDILMDVGNRAVLGYHWLPYYFFSLLWKSMVPQNSLFTNFLQNIFLSVWQNKEMHTGLELLEGQWWHNFHFWMSYPFNNRFVSYKHAYFCFTRYLLMDWSGVDYLWIIVMFLLAVWTHFDGTHSLQRIHWWASDVMLNLSKSVLMQEKTNVHQWWPEGEYIFRKFAYFIFVVELFL